MKKNDADRDPAALNPDAKRALLAELLQKQQEEPAVGEPSFAQERMWFLEQMGGASAVYNVPVVIRMEGRLDSALLERCFREIVRRHESLRTVFERVEDGVRRNVVNNGSLSFAVEKVTGDGESMLRIAEEEIRRPFDLAKGPLMRVRLYEFSQELHLLVITLHHIITDGWSVGVMVTELGKLYEGYAGNLAEPLGPVPIQYGNYVRWQRGWLQGEVLDRQVAYWREQLKAPRSVVELPADRVRPAVQTYLGRTEQIRLDGHITSALDRLAREEGSTPYMVLLAAFMVLLRRYTGLEDVAVGTPVANRRRLEDEGVIGLYVNTLVLRCDLSGNPEFREVVRRVRETALGAYEHQDVPFEKIVEDLHPERDLARTPLFQVMFAMVQEVPVARDMDGVRCRVEDVDTGTSKFDLTLDIVEHSDGKTARWEYNADLFDAQTIRRMAGHYARLLEGFVTDGSRRILELPVLSDRERTLVLREWNATERAYPAGLCLHDLIQEQANRTPEADAVVHGSTRVRYRELMSRADHIAYFLTGRGVGPESLVGLCADRSIEMIAGILGIMKAGGGFVPLDPDYPDERIRYMVDDAGIGLVLTTRATKKRLTDFAVETACVEDIGKGAAGGHTPTARCSPENAAYVIYTSGSTGRPKGVVVEHRSLVNYVFAAIDLYGFTRQDRILQFSSIGFDAAGVEIYPCLASGGTVVLRPKGAVESIPDFLRQCARWGITMLSIPTAYWHEVVSALEVGLGNLPPSLRLVVTGGEKALPARVRAWKTHVGEKVRLLNAYGPTEATIEATIHDLTHDTHAAGEAGEVPIGRPLSNIRAYILDAFLQPVPIGVTGELFLAGACLARGYLNQPDVTAQKFVKDPFFPDGGALMYRTGDQAKYRPDGTIQFVGRVDDQVKIRGFRIELGEVETLLAEHPDVAEVTVVVRENGEHDRCLDAYVVPLEGRALRPADIQDFARERLLGAMRPRAVVVVESLPRTSSDKVDRDLLPEPSGDDLVSAQPEHAAHDPLEMQLVLLWEKIFGRRGIGVRDNFFDLGGHSLLAVRMFSQVEKLTGKNLPLVTLFQAPTIEQLASLLRQEGWEPPWSSLVAIRPGGSKPPLYGVHGVGGNILEFSDLTKYLDPDQPLYGIQAQGLDGKKPWHTSVEEMAEHYIKEIREFQPEGPYHLAGSSFGGMVAYEMARRLVAAGERVGMVALFDTMAPGYPKFLPATTAWKRRVHGWRFRLDLHWSNIRVARGKEKWEYVWEKTERLGREIRNQVKKRRKRIKTKMQRMFFPKAIKSVPKGGTEASEKYRAGPYTGKVTLFRATEQPYGIVDDHTNGWGTLALAGVDVIEVPGHHGSIMREPRAKTLAIKLMGALNAAYAGGTGGDGTPGAELPTRRHETLSPGD